MLCTVVVCVCIVMCFVFLLAPCNVFGCLVWCVLTFDPFACVCFAQVYMLLSTLATYIYICIGSRKWLINSNKRYIKITIVTQLRNIGKCCSTDNKFVLLVLQKLARSSIPGVPNNSDQTYTTIQTYTMNKHTTRIHTYKQIPQQLYHTSEYKTIRTQTWINVQYIYQA